jgi:hypothetical protein
MANIDLTTEFPKYHTAISAYLSARVNTYFASPCYTILKKRYERLRDSIDMKFKPQTENEFASKISLPLLRPRYLFRRASIKGNFRNDPLYTLSAMGNTTVEAARNMQEILRLSLKHTKFRQTTFESLVDFVARYGAAVCYTQFQDVGAKGMRTVYDPQNPASKYQRVKAAAPGSVAVKNYFVHPLNYFQDPGAVDPDESYIRGFIDTWRVSDLAAAYANEQQNYIKENLEKVLKECRENGKRDENTYHDATTGKDESHMTVDVRRVWSTVNIVGNEADDTIYYAEIVGDTVIRFQDNPLDGNIVPLKCYRMRRRPEFWWGNSDCEDVQSHENFYNLMMSLKADGAIAATDRLNLYPRAWGVSNEDMRNRRAYGGWVPYDIVQGMPPINQSIFTHQPVDNSTSQVDWVLRELKESAQGSTSRPDLTRGYNQGGVANKTATAASILASQGDTLDADMLEVFSYDLCGTGDINMRLLQQYLGNTIMLRGDAKQPPRTLEKYEFLGDMTIDVESSLQKNDLVELNRYQNAIMMLSGMQQAGVVQPGQINWDAVIRDVVRMSNIGDVDEIMPPPGQAMGMPTGVPNGPADPAPGMPQMGDGIATIAPAMEGLETGAVT